MKILGCYDHSGPKFHRILMPLHMMSGIEVKIAYQVKEEELAWCDIIFFNRRMPHDLDVILKARDKYGFKLVCDMDDHYILDKDHYLYENYKKYNTSAIFREWIIASDVVTVTHERLYKELLPLNKNIHILPNAIPNHEVFNVAKIECEYTRIFWCGSSTHKRDIDMVVPAFKKIDRTFTKFVIGGYNKDEPEWKLMANAYTNGGRWRSEVIAQAKVEEYYKMYGQCDIALVPLVPNNFNANKSNLKVLEAAHNGSPVIVSRVDPYIGFPEQYVNYVDSHNTWYSQINYLLKNPKIAREQGAQLKNYCAETFNFDRINKHRKEVFDGLCKA